ncbi:MAG: helix-turn-helix domain-containing protein [Halanaerobiaceae bacterium]
MIGNNNIANERVTEITLGEINPFIRITRIHTLEAGFKTSIRYIPHYQLHYVFAGPGYFHIDGKDYTAAKGEFCIWGPGQKHIIASPRNKPLTIAGVQFDFTRNFVDKNYLPISSSKEDFDWNSIHEFIKFTDFMGFEHKIKIKNYVKAEEILKNLVNSYEQVGTYSEEKASAQLKIFFLLVADEIKQKNEGKNEEKKLKIVEYIQQNYTRKIPNKELASKFGYHPVHLNRIIKDITGSSLHQYIIKLRIQESLHLLQNSYLPVGVISKKVGYNNPQYFSRIFKKKTGHPPSYFRE